MNAAFVTLGSTILPHAHYFIFSSHFHFHFSADYMPRLLSAFYYMTQFARIDYVFRIY